MVDGLGPLQVWGLWARSACESQGITVGDHACTIRTPGRLSWD